MERVGESASVIAASTTPFSDLDGEAGFDQREQTGNRKRVVGSSQNRLSMGMTRTPSGSYVATHSIAKSGVSPLISIPRLVFGRPGYFPLASEPATLREGLNLEESFVMDRNPVHARSRLFAAVVQAARHHGRVSTRLSVVEFPAGLRTEKSIVRSPIQKAGSRPLPGACRTPESGIAIAAVPS